MTRAVERQSQQWPHRVARLSAGPTAFRCRIAMPQPTTLSLSNEQPDYTGSHGMKVMRDEQGDWSFKQPKDSLAFTVPLEAAAATLQRQMGLEAPETYAITHQGRPAVISKWYPNSTQAWTKPPRLAELHPDDQMTIQKNHVLDWLIGNHDSHVGNWMRTEDGKLVSIDKGQAVKYFGHDRLDPHFHPNYYAREPIYNQLYRDHAKGYGQLHDPRTGELGEFVRGVQAIPDEHLKAMFRPYAESAARSGLLLNPDGDPSRNLGPRTVPANSPEHFLDALVARKNNLHTDLGEYYDRMSPGQQHLGGRGPHRQGPNPRFRPLNRPAFEWTPPTRLHVGEGDEPVSDHEPDPFDPASYQPRVGSADPLANKFLATWWHDGDDEQYGMYFNSPGNAHKHLRQLGIPRENYRVFTTPGDPMRTEQRWPGGRWDPDADQFDPRQIGASRTAGTVIPTAKGPRRVYTAPDIATTLGVTPTTMANWMRKYPDRVPAPTHQIGGRAHWDDLNPWREWMRVRPAPGRPRKNAPITLNLQDSLAGPSMPPVPRSVVAPLGEETLPRPRRQIKVSPDEDYMNWADMNNSMDVAEMLRGLHSRPGPGEGANTLPRRAQRRRP